MLGTSCKMPSWMKHKLESRLQGETSVTSDIQMAPPYGRKWRRTEKALDESERGGWKAGLKHNIQKTIMASCPITSWQIDGETMETVPHFIFLGFEMVADGDCSHEIKRCLLLGGKAMTKLDSVLKSRSIAKKCPYHQSYLFPVVTYGCESWNIEKAEHKKMDTFELWCWRRLLRVPWTARRSNQSILKEISPEYSLEGLMLKLKLQYFGHLIWRTDSLEKTLMLGKIQDRRGWQRMRCLHGITHLMDMSLIQICEMVKDRDAWHAAVLGVAKVGHDWATELSWILYFSLYFIYTYFININMIQWVVRVDLSKTIPHRPDFQIGNWPSSDIHGY